MKLIFEIACTVSLFLSFYMAFFANSSYTHSILLWALWLFLLEILMMPAIFKIEKGWHRRMVLLCSFFACNAGTIPMMSVIYACEYFGNGI